VSPVTVFEKLSSSTENGGGPAAATTAVQNLLAALGRVSFAETAYAPLLELRVTNVDLHVLTLLSTAEAHRYVRLNGVKIMHEAGQISKSYL
jgi:hypothetical protein